MQHGWTLTGRRYGAAAAAGKVWHMSSDVTHVRLALPAEAAQLAAVQRAAWDADPTMAPMAAAISLDEATQLWHTLILKPPLAHFRVLIALSGPVATGLAFIGPSDDEDAEPTDSLVHEFAIAPAARRQGHGSRLMQAAVDTMRLDGYRRATWWVGSTDDITREFLTSAGWAADGAHRELATEDDAYKLKQVRLHTDISDSKN